MMRLIGHHPIATRSHLQSQLELGLFGRVLHFEDEVHDMLNSDKVAHPLYNSAPEKLSGTLYCGRDWRFYQLSAMITPQLITPGVLPRKLQGPPAPMEIRDSVHEFAISFTGLIPFTGEMEVFIGTRESMIKSFADESYSANPLSVNMDDPKLVHLWLENSPKNQAAVVRYPDDTFLVIATKHMSSVVTHRAPMHLMMIDPLGETDV